MKQQSQPNATEMDTAVTRLDSRVDSLHEPPHCGGCGLSEQVERGQQAGAAPTMAVAAARCGRIDGRMGRTQQRAWFVTNSTAHSNTAARALARRQQATSEHQWPAAASQELVTTCMGC